MRQLANTMFITNNHALFHLWSEEIYSNVKKSQNIMSMIVETTDHRLASFFSMHYRSFLLTLDTFHILSQCYYFNFKQVNIDWEVFC